METREMETGSTVSVTVRLPGDLVEWLRRHGIENCRTLSGEVLLGLLKFRDQVVFLESRDVER